MSMRDRFFVRVLRGSLPLWIWAAHFFTSYALVAAQCSPAAITSDAPNVPVLALLSLAAAGACLALLWRERRLLRHPREHAQLLDWAAAGSGVLALAGILWTSVPLLLLDGCG